MGEIRELDESHVADVAAMYLKVICGQDRKPGPDLVRYVQQVLLENPWRTPDIPSWVYLHEGVMVGCIGVIARPMVWKGKPVRAAISTQFMVDRTRYRGFAGVELLRKFFNGPQDLSLTDGATEASFITWTSVGGSAAWLYSLEWTRLLHPARYINSIVKQRPGKQRWAASLLAPAAFLSDAAISRFPLRRFGAPVSEYSSHSATPQEILEVIGEAGWKEKLHPAYDPESFPWLLQEAAKAKVHGTLRCRVVTDPQGKRVGWYVYFAKPGDVSMVLQLSAPTRHFDQVLLDLFRDAWTQGAIAVRGRVIPRYLTQFHNQYCSFRHMGSGVLVHSRDRDLLTGILQGDAFLSLLDGEWWMRFSAENWS